MSKSNLKKKHKRKRKPKASPLAIGDRVDVFLAKTGISRPTAYRMMHARKLKYVQVCERIRLIPITEYVRLGLVETKTAA